MDKKIAVLLNEAAKHGIRDPNVTDVIQAYLFTFSKVRSLIKIIIIIVSTNNKI